MAADAARPTTPLRDDAIFLALALPCIAITLLPPAHWKMLANPLPTLWLAWLAYRHTREGFGLLVAAALACGAAGDALLAPVDKDLFVAGAIAFLVGHLFYISAFLRGNRLRASRLWIALPLFGFGWVLSIAVREAMTVRGEEELFAGVAIYGTVLLATAVVAFARRNVDWCIPAGMLVFVASDAHIAFNNLIFHAPVTPLVTSGMLTYYLAQWLILRGAMQENAIRRPSPS